MPAAKRVRRRMDCSARLGLCRVRTAVRHDIKLPALPGDATDRRISQAEVFAHLHPVRSLVGYILRRLWRRLARTAVQLPDVRCAHVVCADADGVISGDASPVTMGRKGVGARGAWMVGALAGDDILSVRAEDRRARRERGGQRRGAVPLGRISLE